MMRNQFMALSCVVCLAACDLEVGDLNNPGIDTLTDNPSPSVLAAASTGLLVTLRQGVADPNGTIAELGIFGREVYNFDPADPRFISELIIGPLNPGSPAFGGNHWNIPYQGIRNAEILLAALDSVPQETLTDAQKEATRGYAKTIQALEYQVIYDARYDLGGVIVHSTDPTVLDPIVSREALGAYMETRLDEAKTHLMNGGDSFPFPLSSGFEGFDTPETFIAFNRAVKARLSVYQGQHARALTELAESFIRVDDVNPVFDLGVYHAFRSAGGDLTNNLVAPQLYAHPSIRDTADMTTGGAIDLRVSSKLDPLEEEVTNQDLTAHDHFKMYKIGTPVPIIRNEELILLRAEAEIFTDDLVGANEDLSFVRTHAGGLEPYPAFATRDEAIDALIYERRYSLLFEGGHRWIDLRRLGKLDTLPTDGGEIFTAMPIPLPETLPR